MRFYLRYVTLERNKELIKELNKFQIQYNIEEKTIGNKELFSLKFYIYEDEADFEKKKITFNNFEIFKKEGTEFSNEEIEKAEWFQISTGQFGYPQPKDDYLDECYDLSHNCPTCNIGKKLIKPIRFESEPKAKHSQFLGVNWIFDEIFVRDIVKSIFEKENITGIDFVRPILHKNSTPLKTIYQLIIDSYLSNGLIVENLSYEVCQMVKDPKMVKFLKAIKSNLVKGPFCGNIKYNFPLRGTISFKKETFNNQPDFVRINKWFGSGGSANHPILVSKKVREVIIREQWRGVFLTPIFLV